MDPQFFRKYADLLTESSIIYFSKDKSKSIDMSAVDGNFADAIKANPEALGHFKFSVEGADQFLWQNSVALTFKNAAEAAAHAYCDTRNTKFARLTLIDMYKD